MKAAGLQESLSPPKRPVGDPEIRHVAQHERGRIRSREDRAMQQPIIRAEEALTKGADPLAIDVPRSVGDRSFV